MAGGFRKAAGHDGSDRAGITDCRGLSYCGGQFEILVPQRCKARILLLTSVNPAEGKSTSSVNMALSYAQMGAKVLLIDADLRRPTLHAKLGIQNLSGLSDYAAGQADLSAITRPVDGLKHTFVITAGQSRLDPLRLWPARK